MKTTETGPGVFPDADYYEVPERFDVYSWCPSSDGSGPATQVHLHFGSPPGPVSLPHCPKCGRLENGFAHTTGQPGPPPVADDVSICFYCAAILVIVKGDGLQLREMTRTEFVMLPMDIFYEVVTARARILAKVRR